MTEENRLTVKHKRAMDREWLWLTNREKKWTRGVTGHGWHMHAGNAEGMEHGSGCVMV